MFYKKYGAPLKKSKMKHSNILSERMNNKSSLALKVKNLIYKNDHFVSLNDVTGKK